MVSIVASPFLLFSARAENTVAYYPSSYNLLGSTQLVSGSLGNLQSDDGNYLTFRSYPNYDFKYAESLEESSWNASTSYQDKVVLTFTPPISADYILIATAEVQGACTPSYDVKARLCTDTSVYQELLYRIQDTTDWYPFCALKRINLPASSQTFKIQYAISNTAANAKIRNARLYAFSLSGQYAESETESSTTSTSWQNKVTLTFTPPTAGDYLIIATANVGGSSTSYSTLTQLIQDGSIVHAGPIREPSTSGARYTFGVMRKINLSATSHTFKIQYRTESSGTTAYIKYAHIVAIRMDQFPNFYYNENEGESAPAAPNTWYDKVTNTYTAQAADHLIICSILYKSGDTSSSVGLNLLQGAAVAQEPLIEHKDTTDYETCFMTTKASLPAGSTTDKIQYRGESTSARVKNARLISLQLPSIQYTAEVEFTGSSNTLDWTQLVWVVDSAWTTPSVTVTLQLYNYNLGQYPTSGDGYVSYASSATANTDETKSQTITSNPTYFRDASGNWKIKVKGVKSTTTQFDFKADLVEYKTTTHVAQAPIASFTYSPANPLMYDTVTFNASASYDPDGNIVSYKWDFGDGNVTTVTNPVITHVYTNATSTVNYTVTLTVTDNEGLTGVTTQIVPVTNPAILYVSLPAGTYVGPNPDNWLSQCWLLNITGISGTFTVRITDTSCGVKSYDTHLIIALNNASYQYLSSLTVGTTTIPKSSFTYGTPKPYGYTLTWENDVYPTWFSDTYVVGTINPNSYKDVTVSVAFSNATGVRMHFDAYGSATYPPPPASSKHVTRNPHQKDSTVLFWPPPPPLSVSISPTSVTMNLGQHVTFTSTVSGGTPPYSYQWYLNGTAVSGANASSWTFIPTSAGFYTVYVNVTDGTSATAKSNVASVRVNPVLTVSISPTNVTIDLGQSVTFSSTVAGGTSPYFYQWYLNGTSVSGATNPSWTFTPISTGFYRVYLNVSDSATVDPFAISNIANVTVNPQLTVSISPPSTTITLGQSVLFSAIVSGGTAPYSYKWDANGTWVPGETNPTFNFTPTQPGYYNISLLVTDNAGVNASAFASVTVLVLKYYLTVETDPPDITTIPGEGWYANCTYVTLTAPQFVPSEAGVDGQRYKFVNWTVDGGVFTTLQITVHMDANHTAIAHYVLQYYLSMSTNFGTVSPGSGWHDAGSTVQISATAPSVINGERYVWLGWTGTGTISYTGMNNAASVTMNSPITQTAAWSHEYRLTMATNYGTTTPTIGQHWYSAGQGVSIQAFAPSLIYPGQEQYIWNGWTGTGDGSYSTLNNPASITMNGPITETASWTRQFLLTIKTKGLPSAYPTKVYLGGLQMGTASDTSPYTQWFVSDTSTGTIGVDNTVLGATNTRYLFVKWVEDSSTSNPRASETMNSPKTFTAEYKTQYYLTVTSPYDSPTPISGWFDNGTSITASVTSPWPPGATDTRYVCTGWTGTGSVPPSGTTTSVTFTIKAPSSITWKWKTQYLLTVRTFPDGLSPQPTRNPAGEAGSGGWWYDNSTNVQLTAQPVTGYTFLNWEVDSIIIPGNPTNVHMDEPHVATARYKALSPAVGGFAAPIDIGIGKEAPNLLASQVGLAFAFLAAMTATILLTKRRSKTLKREY